MSTILLVFLALSGAAASRVTGSHSQGSDIQALHSRREQSAVAHALNRSIADLDESTQKKKKKEKTPCEQVVSGSEARKRSHLWGGDCKCPHHHVVAGRSWECGDALGQRKFSSKIGPSSCHCAPISECGGMVAGAKKRNSHKKNPDRPCKCENKEFVLEGKAPECSVYLGERYFPNTLPPQECSCQPPNFKQYACSEIATRSTDSEKDKSKCKCPEGTFLGGEAQQCKDFYGATFFPKRLKPGLCMCSANALRPGMGSSTGLTFSSTVLGLMLLLWMK